MKRLIWSTLGVLVGWVFAYIALRLGAPDWGALIAGFVAYAHWQTEPMKW